MLKTCSCLSNFIFAKLQGYKFMQERPLLVWYFSTTHSVEYQLFSTGTMYHILLHYNSVVLNVSIVLVIFSHCYYLYFNHENVCNKVSGMFVYQVLLNITYNHWN